MDIYAITDRDPAERDRRGPMGRFTSNGSVASHSSQLSHASRSSPPVIVSNRKYVSPAFDTQWHVQTNVGKELND